ncbi:hypothetical protein BN903_367 [Halorubrum sp. AJ67]|nr:hypothetical protein BN903_367 [Halorubrum sp. AJ67]
MLGDHRYRRVRVRSYKIRGESGSLCRISGTECERLVPRGRERGRRDEI